MVTTAGGALGAAVSDCYVEDDVAAVGSGRRSVMASWPFVRLWMARIESGEGDDPGIVGL
jgi:hypothetical protein